MSRLNKSIREGIINNAIEACGYNRRNESLIKRRANLANDVRLFAIGGEEKEREVIEKFNRINKHLKSNEDNLISCELSLADKDDEVYVNFSGMAVNLSFNGLVERGGDLVYKNFVSSRYNNRVSITRDNPLYSEFEAVESEQKVIKDIKSQVVAEVTAMVNSVTTIKKLIEVWPESKELLPEEQSCQSTALVADVNRLNAVIGLPKED